MDCKSDEKLELCLNFVLRQYKHFVAKAEKRRDGDIDAASCFVVGMTGCQGCGKTTLASTLATTLATEPYAIPTLNCSIDQFYLTHEAQVDLARAHPSNCLIRSRGEPSTHDLSLAVSVLTSLRRGLPTHVPSYDKSAFNGEGDRNPIESWEHLNARPKELVRILILEGWCIGFAALPASLLIQRWINANQDSVRKNRHSRLARCKLSSLIFINSALKEYDKLTSLIDCLIHLDAQDPLFVYDWRLQQEHSLWRTNQAGMSDSQVIDFVNNYYPAYELYTDALRSDSGNMRYQRLRLVLNVNRQLVHTLDDGRPR